MEFFTAVERRRSVRKFTSTPVPPNVMEQALNAAVLAPNSSNIQTWRLYWVRSTDKKQKLVEACLSQSAATTAAELVVFVADPAVWQVGQTAVLDALGPKAAASALNYYRKLIPFLYGWRWLAPVKWLIFNGSGLFRPSPRHPWSSRDIAEVCIKSTALAAENFMLAIAALGFDTCPMEGFDECRVARLLQLGRRARVVMVVSVGERSSEGVWGERLRLPHDIVIKQV